MKIVSYLFLAMVVAAGLAIPALAQQQADHQATPPLIQLLQSKGILSADEAAQLSQAATPDEANERLARLLVQKGLISPDDYTQTVGASTVSANATGSNGGHLLNAVVRIPSRAPSMAGGVGGAGAAEPAPADGPVVIPAVTPTRVLPIDTPKQGGLVPDISLGSGAKMKVYGFFKVSAVSDTTSSGGATFGSQDWPLPLLLADTGPTSDPQVHIKARSFRIGSQFEWVPKNSGVTVTGRVEGDFEGDYTNVNNRNISGVRSNQFSLRLAWVRLDTKWGETPVFAEFGQDWTLLGSSTLPNLFETTGLGVGMGSLYERIPQFKIGAQFGHGSFKVQPEFAITLAAAGTSALTDEQRARFGDRAGAENNQPGVEGRVVFQFPLNQGWKAVAPAQIIFSGHHAQMNEIIPVGNLPLNTNANIITGATGCSVFAPNGVGCTIRGFFPTGVSTTTDQNIWTAEVQLPTPWVTLDGKFYRGGDMRFFFGGQVNDIFTDLNGGLSPGSATAFDSRVIPFTCINGNDIDGFDCGGAITIANLRPVRGLGGFVEASFPLSRIFNANPEGHNAGWVFHLQYGTDRTVARDVRRSGANGLARTDLDTASLTYRLNKWVTFVQETSYIATRAANEDGKIFRGVPATQAHSWRNEFGTVFTF